MLLVKLGGEAVLPKEEGLGPPISAFELRSATGRASSDDWFSLTTIKVRPSYLPQRLLASLQTDIVEREYVGEDVII
jgi:hypothetical protein